VSMPLHSHPYHSHTLTTSLSQFSVVPQELSPSVSIYYCSRMLHYIAIYSSLLGIEGLSDGSYVGKVVIS